MEENRQRFYDVEMAHFKAERKKKRPTSPLFTVSLSGSVYVQGVQVKKTHPGNNQYDTIKQNESELE